MSNQYMVSYPFVSFCIVCADSSVVWLEVVMELRCRCPPFFWVVAQFSGMDTTTALKRQTVSTLLQGLVGISLIMLLGLIFL